MFIREPFKVPPGAESSFEVRYAKGRKPFATRAESDVFAAEQRALPNGWAEISQVIRIVVEKRR